MLNLPVSDNHKQREQKLFEYIEKHKEEIQSKDLIYLALGYWVYLQVKIYNTSKQILEVPDCCPVARSIDGIDCIRYGWDKGEHYLEIEILVDGTKEFFYRNRLTKEASGEDYFPEAEISDYMIDKLLLFTE